LVSKIRPCSHGRGVWSIGRHSCIQPQGTVLGDHHHRLRRDQIYEIIAKIKKQGVTMILVEQNATLALSACDFAYIMMTGEIRLCGTAAELAAKDDLIK
jgi:ABC-type branched-subunit amino acid transport system ATPase component